MINLTSAAGPYYEKFDSYLNHNFNQGFTNPGLQTTQVTTFYMLEPNI